MTILLRCLLALLVVLALTLPGIGGDGGENGGGSGVWILPRCSTVTSGPSLQRSAGSGMTFAIPDVRRDTSIQTSAEMGTTLATAVDDVSRTPLGLPVAGHTVVLPGHVMVGYLDAGVTSVRILAVDDAQRGYVLRLVMDPATRTGQLTIE